MVTVITGITLAGKSTLAKFLQGWGYKPLLEYTTRPMRNYEKNGVDYNFIDDELFDRMVKDGDFAEVFYVDTIYGLWKYGARKEELIKASEAGGFMLVCGPTQVAQIIDAGIPVLSVLLDITMEEAMARAAARGDNMEEISRRYLKDKPDIDKIRGSVSMVLDASNSVEANARAIDTRLAVERIGEVRHVYRVNGQRITTCQEMGEGEISMYLAGDRGLVPYLRFHDSGMPKNPVDQVAWLLLQGAGCGFCKVCREKPCDIKDGEKCTKNIANYIRECVRKEDREGNNGT